MKIFQQSSVTPPFKDPRVAPLMVRSYLLAQNMGLIPVADSIVRLDASVLPKFCSALDNAGIAREPLIVLQNVMLKNAGDERLVNLLTHIREAMVNCPAPKSELPVLEERLGPVLLTRLLHIHPSSLQRYKNGEREIPDDIAVRLHFLSLIVGDLAGAYNDIGIRTWFERKRKTLDDKTPLQLLKKNWKPDDPGPRKVQLLTSALTSFVAT